ncbi:SpaH/EbpB family LPXTG-anchored major pilin [Corynebacterium diphtheriae bv. gravis]|uniref:SpaH/EbpB family LPXTG-anchored major pilin n=1 Tax=Corynebacterium diphtheriae TaxID=1717 RepID=UPI0018CB134B|nr:SpaH/EbpB family LPXTG-anchored major pilin [Corynebacterium diphtheriae]MBG9297141.1 SpaH/EbpB family LPXTG-anchored major pilin [Corynebacterium diphtheriae bv. gravis]
MNKFSRTARSVTFAAIVGLSLGVSAPGAFAQETAVNRKAGNSPLVNKTATGALTIHKFGNPVSENAPSGTEADAAAHEGDEKLDGVGFTVYRVNKTADGQKDVDLTTNDGLLLASMLKANQYASGVKATQDLIDNGVLTEYKKGETKDGKWEVGKDVPLGVYLVVETTPKEGYDPAAPFLAYVPMTSGNGDGKSASDKGQGVTWNYDVHAFPKNYKDTEPKKSVQDKDQNNGDKSLIYTVVGIARQLKPEVKRNQFKITDTIDPKLTVTDVAVKIVSSKEDENSEGVSVPAQDVVGEKFFTGNEVSVELKPEAAKKLKDGDKVVVTITTTVKDATKEPFDVVPNTAKVYQNKPGGEQDETPKETPTVKTYWGGVQFKKVDSAHKGLLGAEFQIVRIESPKKCKDVNVKNDGGNTAFTLEQQALNPVSGVQNGKTLKTFTSGDNGKVLITGLHVNDFANNARVDAPSKYCLVETKAPEGKELLAEPLEFQLLAKSEAQERQYELATLKVGDVDGEVINVDDTTPNLPMTGGAGVGILAAIGAAIIGAGAWFARRNSAES